MTAPLYHFPNLPVPMTRREALYEAKRLSGPYRPTNSYRGQLWERVAEGKTR